jgi:SAM-dependent MidA family methyltransferase
MRGGQRLVKAEYLNSIAEAQKAQGVAPILGWVNDMVTIAKTLGRTDVTDKVNFDGVAEMTADMRGVPAKLVVPDDVIQARRQAQAQAAQQQVQQQQAVEQAKAVKDLSQADPEQMDRMFSAFGSAAQAEATGGGM